VLSFPGGSLILGLDSFLRGSAAGASSLATGSNSSR
jgi:hypothetical protein